MKFPIRFELIHSKSKELSKKRVFVLDENIQSPINDPQPEYVINARFLYFLNGETKTNGHSDDYLMEVANKFQCTVVTKDKMFVRKLLLAYHDVVYVKEKESMDIKDNEVEFSTYQTFVLITSNNGKRSSKVIDENDFGITKMFDSANEKIKFIGLEHLISNSSGSTPLRVYEK